MTGAVRVRDLCRKQNRYYYGRSHLPASQNVSANWPRLAEAGGRLEPNLALAGRAGGANWGVLKPLRDCFRHGDETGHWSRTVLNWTDAGGEAPNARNAMAK